MSQLTIADVKGVNWNVFILVSLLRINETSDAIITHTMGLSGGHLRCQVTGPTFWAFADSSWFMLEVCHSLARCRIAPSYLLLHLVISLSHAFRASISQALAHELPLGEAEPPLARCGAVCVYPVQ